MLQIFLKFASSIFLNQMIKIYSWLTHQTIIFQTISTELKRFCYILISLSKYDDIHACIAKYIIYIGVPVLELQA